jgi:hypothetical protein
MIRPFAALCLAAALAAPLSARADDASDRLAAAKALVQTTVIKTLETGFAGALEKTVVSMPADKADSVRTEVRAEFEKQRGILIEGLSKEYAEKFSLDELKRIQAIYDDKTYQKFQAMNADPASTITLISQNAVTKILNLLSLVAANDGGGQQAPTPMPGR